MSNTTLIAIILVIAGLALIIYNYKHKKHIEYNRGDLKKAVETIFSEQNEQVVTRKNFIKGLVHYFNCSRKDALYLLGKAREANIITQDGKEIKQAG